MVALTADELLVAAPDTAEPLVASLSGDDDDPVASVGAPGLPVGASDPNPSPGGGSESVTPVAVDEDSVARGADEIVTATTTGSEGVVGVAVTVGAAGAASAKELLFSASASGYAGAPPMAVTVHFDLGDATPGIDYAGMPEGRFSITIPLSAGTGVARVGYSELDPALLDTRDAAVLAIAKGTASNNAAVAFVPAGGGETATMSSGGAQWAAGSPIDGTITTSRGDNPTIQINAPLSLTMNAYDTDMRFNGMFWAPHADDVTSGETASDYHIIWSASAGTMVDQYGTTAMFIAPDYAAGQDVREVTITAVVDDMNRGADVDGFNDAALNVAEPVNVFQITLTIDQGSGPGNPPTRVSPNYDGPAVPEFFGGGQLGWIEPGSPPGTTRFGGATQVKGTIAAPGPPSGWTWAQDKKGLRAHTEDPPDGPPFSVVDDHWPNWVPDKGPGGAANEWQDADARHPNVTGPDTQEIFFLDTPGVALNPDPGIWTAYHFDMDYKTWVNGPDGRASNELEWEVKFDVTFTNGAWGTEPGHVP